MTNIFGININQRTKESNNSQNFNRGFSQDFNQDLNQDINQDFNQNSYKTNSNSDDEVVYKKDDIVVMKGHKNK